MAWGSTAGCQGGREPWWLIGFNGKYYLPPSHRFGGKDVRGEYIEELKVEGWGLCDGGNQGLFCRWVDKLVLEMVADA